MSTGIEAIAAERKRQIDAEGWTPEHDDLHGSGEIAGAAACYAMHDLDIGANRLGSKVRLLVRDLWPWDKSWWKPKSRRENLVRAGALIAAEIDRIDRAASAPSVADGHADERSASGRPRKERGTAQTARSEGLHGPGCTRMTEASRDSQRAIEAAKLIIDGRDPIKDRAQVLITLDHTIALLVLVAMENDPRKAVQMFNEGTVPHVEERIMLFASKQS